MPYVIQFRREELETIVKAIGQLDILGDVIVNPEKIGEIVRLMEDLKVIVNGDLNYILFTVCKRYVTPSYNNYKKYLLKISYHTWMGTSNIIPMGDLPSLIFRSFFIKSRSDIYRNNLVGELNCCASEIYRKIIADYEEIKEIENGSIK